MSSKVEKCLKCKSYLIKFPCSSVCPKCENSEIHRLAKVYAEKQLETVN